MSAYPKATSPAPEPSLPRCRHCDGRGQVRRIDAAGSLDDETCKECDGTGTGYDDHGGNIGVQVLCRSCNGTGQAMNKEAELEWCMWCRGTGVVKQ